MQQNIIRYDILKEHSSCNICLTTGINTNIGVERKYCFMKIRKQQFTCDRGGLTIRGMQYFPENFEQKRRYPTVIASHGFLCNYTSMEKWCRDFAKIGYVAFCFSFCGGGNMFEEEALKSDGESTKMSVLTEVEDLIAVKKFACQHTYVDLENLILLGESQGGFVSGLAAAKCGAEIKKLVMIFPALCIPDHARRGCLGGSKYQTEKVPEILDCGQTLLGRAFYEEAVQMEPYLQLSPYSGQVLILQGLEDDIVNYSYAIRAKENYKKGQCHLQLVRNMGHGFSESQYQSAFASVRQFLAGREEILTIRIVITRCESLMEGETRVDKLFFTGWCETKYFQGTILPSGCDVQKHFADGAVNIRAEYTLEGLDSCGERCKIHIVNQRGEMDWKPIATTDSAELAWLNSTNLTAVVEEGQGGPTIRIYRG